MSDGEQEEEKPFAIERAKTGRAKCKKCKCPIDKDQVRIAKLMANPFGDGKMKSWHHVSCIFEVFTKQRATTKRIENPEEDVSGWDGLCSEDKDIVLKKLAEFEDAEPFKAAKAKGKAKSPKTTPAKAGTSGKVAADDKKPTGSKTDSPSKIGTAATSPVARKTHTQDDMFSEFRRLCDDLSSCSSYLEKTAIVKKLFTKGSQKDKFQSDITLWCRLLLPGSVKRIYNLQSKALIKLFARILCQDEDAMLEDLEQGDVAMTIKTFFESSLSVKPNEKSVLTLQEVDAFLEQLSTLTKEDEQTHHFKSILKRCTSDDLKMIIRLIKHDLRINAGPKHILGAVHDDAYEAFQVSRDLPAVIRRCMSTSSAPAAIVAAFASSKPPKTGKIASLSLMTPVLPMLAEACKSVEMAIQKCPNGMLSEVKYDGERVQVHKQAGEFRYFSRSLKPVLAHKVNSLKEYIPKAFPEGDDLILDAEVLLIDTRNGQPLPFGSLGVHKKNEFKDANICLFVFDIIYYNGKPLMDWPIRDRRKLLEEKMTPINNRIMLSETKEINEPRALAEMIAKVFKLRLEGLVLKDVDSKYEPGKRHWLKVKKDYLFQGAMADSADLVVLGAWYGTGQKGGIMSVFLMGCYDSNRDVWLTVTKVHTGHDDATLAGLQTSLDMVKIGKDPNLLPKWLRANKVMIPDFVARDPKKQPVWEITGAEFTNQGVHTADGISIRFPRVTRIRDDKDWETATSLQELRELFNKSAESIDYSLLLGAGEIKRPAELGDSPRKKQKKGDRHDGDDDDDDRSASTSKKNTSIESDQNEAAGSDAGDSMELDDAPTTSKMEKVEKSPKKTPRKSCDTRDSEGKQSSGRGAKVKRRTEEGDSHSAGISEEARKPEFYSFIGTDYIEYTAAGSPLNWIEGRKPPKHLPRDAQPIDSLDEDKRKIRCLLSDVRACYARDLSRDRRKVVGRTLKTLGAAILSEAEQSQATHVIHGCPRVPATILLESTDVPKSARHVTESWLDAVVASCKVKNTGNHAVTLSGVYCSCPCPHQV